MIARVCESGMLPRTCWTRQDERSNNDRYFSLLTMCDGCTHNRGLRLRTTYTVKVNPNED